MGRALSDKPRERCRGSRRPQRC